MLNNPSSVRSLHRTVLAGRTGLQPLQCLKPCYEHAVHQSWCTSPSHLPRHWHLSLHSSSPPADVPSPAAGAGGCHQWGCVLLPWPWAGHTLPLWECLYSGCGRVWQARCGLSVTQVFYSPGTDTWAGFAFQGHAQWLFLACTYHRVLSRWNKARPPQQAQQKVAVPWGHVALLQNGGMCFGKINK